MDGFLKKIKINSLANAIIYAVLGLVLMVWPVTSASVLCLALGAVLLLCGAVDIILFLTHRDGSLYSGGLLVLGVVLAVLGVWIIASPQLVAVLVPRVIGVLICLHGIGDMGDALTLRRASHPRWTVALILGLLTLALGAVLVFYSFTVLSTIVRILGAFLLYDGISDIWITAQVSKAVKQAVKDAQAQENAVDVDFTQDGGPQA